MLSMRVAVKVKRVKACCKNRLREKLRFMEYRTFGRTGWKISEIGFGAWGIGGTEWGPPDDKTSLPAINQAIHMGVKLNNTHKNGRPHD